MNTAKDLGQRIQSFVLFQAICKKHGQYLGLYKTFVSSNDNYACEILIFPRYRYVRFFYGVARGSKPISDFNSFGSPKERFDYSL